MKSNMDAGRLDRVIVEQKLAANREEAQRLIRAGKVLINEIVVDKPGQKVKPSVSIRVIQPESRFVSRGGLKLEEALRRFSIDVTHWTAADLGASTGGFTDCLLQSGAAKVYAIDVGYGQLAYRLQQDPRVVVMDRTNCRYLQCKDLGEPVDLVTADLSFISLKTVFPAVMRIVKEKGIALFLIKPQFEIGKGRVGKKGIVRNRNDHLETLLGLVDFFQQSNWTVEGIVPSPIQGKSGNIEFLFYITRESGKPSITPEAIEAVVDEAHSMLKQ